MKVFETLLSNCYIPQVLETRREGEVGGATERDGLSGPPTERPDYRKKPLPLPQEKEPGQSENEPINLFQSISVFFQISQGRIEKLTSLLSKLSGTPLTMETSCKGLGLEPQRKEIPHDSRTKKLIEGLSEDPEDHPDGFISIIERHDARLKKAYLLHEATRDIVQQKWIEGTALEDIGKLLQSWAPEPYWNKPVPKGVIQALLNTAPNSQVWAPIDLSNCIFRYTEVTDSIDDLVRAFKNLGTLEGPTSQDPKITPVDGSDLTITFPKMRTLHEIRRDWLSDEELRLAIPEGETTRHCLTHAPRHSWKLMVEFFLALNTNVGS